MNAITKKPSKKTDTALYALLQEKINEGNYVFLNHAKQRLRDRNILDTDIIGILEKHTGYSRNRNKAKDKYEEGKDNWNYCLEGCNPDKEMIRVIVSFNEALLLLIITAIKLRESKL